MSLDLELAKSINKHTIVCFVRSYDVQYHGQPQKKNTIVKAYTVQELLQILPGMNNDNLSEIWTSLLVPSILKQQHKPEEQMFSPTTKLVLEEIIAVKPHLLESSFV